MSLTEAAWRQFAMQVFGVQSVPPFREDRGSQGIRIGTARLRSGNHQWWAQTLF